MIDNKLSKIIIRIAKQIDDLNYVLIGSANLAIQNIDLNPRDIDILTDKTGMAEFDKRFSKFRTKKKYYDKSDGRNSWRAFYEIEGIEIEVLQNVNYLCRPKDELNKTVYIDIDNQKIKCSNLQSELFAYENMGRSDKVKLIKEKL